LLRTGLGSTSLTTDAAGALLARVLHYPYGETRYTEGTLTTDYQYTGQRNEQGIGLYDYVARHYDPALGRFVSADTIVPGTEQSRSWNRYAYVWNNPMAYVDSSGHMPGYHLVDGQGGNSRPPVWAREEAADVAPAADETPASAEPAADETLAPAGEWLGEELREPATYYVLYQNTVEASVECGAPAVLNRLSLDSSVHAVTRSSDGATLWYGGWIIGSRHLDNPQVLQRTVPGAVPIVGDAFAMTIVVGQDVWKYTVGAKRGASFDEFVCETSTDMMGYGVSSVAGDVAGAGTGTVGLTLGGPPGAVAGYVVGDFVASTSANYLWDTNIKPGMMEACLYRVPNTDYMNRSPLLR
jgi:RHS repeat-associated protein